MSEQQQEDRFIQNQEGFHQSARQAPSHFLSFPRKRQAKSKNIDKQESYSQSDSNNDGKKKVGKWTEEEDMKLQHLIDEYGEKSWRIISDMMEGRTAIQCLHRWTKILKPGLRKGPWQEEEDEKLLEWVKNNGPCKWSICAESIQGRSGKQCRERWFNNLNPNVKKGGWTQEEDESIFRGYLQYSSSWSKIAKTLIGRTENSVKNRFYSTVRKLLADQDKEGTIKNYDKKTSGAALQSFVREQLFKLSGNKGLNMEPEQEQEGQDMEQKIEKKSVDDINEEDEDEEEEIFQEKKSDCNQKEIKMEQHDDDSKSRKKGCESYPEQNLLYRLLKQQGGPIKRTSCMKDYSTIYKKYKKRYNQKKRDKKLSEKVEILRRLILKREDENNDYNERDKRSMELLQKKSLKNDLEKQISKVENQLVHLSNQQQRQVFKTSNRLNQSNENSQSQSEDKLRQQGTLNNDQMIEFQNRLLEFFNQSLAEVMKKFQQDIQTSGKAQQQQWQMILAPSDARIVYPPANMPPNIQLANPQQFPNMIITTDQQKMQQEEQDEDKSNLLQQQLEQHMQILPQQLMAQQQQVQMEQQQEEEEEPRKKKKAKKNQNLKLKVKQEDEEKNNQNNKQASYDNIVQNFLQKFNHLDSIRVSQLGQTINEGKTGGEKGFQNHILQDTKIDQKMIFLISQLHTLENMLGNTKKELGKLECSLHEKMNMSQQNNSSHDQQE